MAEPLSGADPVPGASGGAARGNPSSPPVMLDPTRAGTGMNPASSTRVAAGSGCHNAKKAHPVTDGLPAAAPLRTSSAATSPVAVAVTGSHPAGMVAVIGGSEAAQSLGDPGRGRILRRVLVRSDALTKLRLQRSSGPAPVPDDGRPVRPLPDGLHEGQFSDGGVGSATVAVAGAIVGGRGGGGGGGAAPFAAGSPSTWTPPAAQAAGYGVGSLGLAAGRHGPQRGTAQPAARRHERHHRSADLPTVSERFGWRQRSYAYPRDPSMLLQRLESCGLLGGPLPLPLHLLPPWARTPDVLAGLAAGHPARPPPPQSPQDGRAPLAAASSPPLPPTPEMGEEGLHPAARVTVPRSGPDQLLQVGDRRVRPRRGDGPHGTDGNSAGRSTALASVARAVREPAAAQRGGSAGGSAGSGSVHRPKAASPAAGGGPPGRHLDPGGLIEVLDAKYDLKVPVPLMLRLRGEAVARRTPVGRVFPVYEAAEAAEEEEASGQPPGKQIGELTCSGTDASGNGTRWYVRGIGPWLRSVGGKQGDWLQLGTWRPKPGSPGVQGGVSVGAGGSRGPDAATPVVPGSVGPAPVVGVRASGSSGSMAEPEPDVRVTVRLVPRDETQTA